MVGERLRRCHLNHEGSMKQLLLPMYKHDHITKEDYQVTLRTLTRVAATIEAQ